jgi:hypothetical protein
MKPGLVKAHPSNVAIPYSRQLRPQAVVSDTRRLMMVTIPDPTSMANNIFQIADTIRRWQELANDARASADAQLLAQANLLVIAMNAYANGYGRLIGEFQDFRPSWERGRRRKMEKKFRAWMDPRDITNEIRQRLTALTMMRSERTKLDKLISDAEGFLYCTVEPLLNAKESDIDRARVIDALTMGQTAEEARVVTGWAKDAKDRLALSKEQLVSANKEVARLTVRLTELNKFTEIPIPETPWHGLLGPGSGK